ncbi:MAG TPA: hypothetical protein VMF55_13585 [Solirubrobacterales bacterium]|nr:hypothetical protein [Solirubrobacterales bacterium]
MLLRTGYDRHYVAACRESVGAAIEELRRVGAGSAAWNQLLPALDRWFELRNPKVEAHDGNPLNEVRVLATCVTEHGSVVAIPRGIKLSPETSVLGFEEGEEISLDGDAFERLFDAFLAEVEAKFT